MIKSVNLFKKYYFAYSLQNKLKILSSNPHHYLKIMYPGFCLKKKTKLGSQCFMPTLNHFLKISQTKGFKT